jgi:hypothetical protein
MKRVITGFFLTLILVLTGGYTQLYAHTLSAQANFAPRQLVKHDLPTGDQLSHASESSVIEEEDDDTTSSRKYLDSVPLSTPQYFNPLSVQRLPFSKSFVNLAESRSYILFRVFRI